MTKNWCDKNRYILGSRENRSKALSFFPLEETFQDTWFPARLSAPRTHTTSEVRRQAALTACRSRRCVPANGVVTAVLSP